MGVGFSPPDRTTWEHISFVMLEVSAWYSMCGISPAHCLKPSFRLSSLTVEKDHQSVPGRHQSYLARRHLTIQGVMNTEKNHKI